MNDFDNEFAQECTVTGCEHDLSNHPALRAQRDAALLKRTIAITMMIAGGASRSERAAGTTCRARATPPRRYLVGIAGRAAGRALAPAWIVIRIAVVSLLAGCIVPIASPSARVEGGYAMSSHEVGRRTLRAGAHVVGNRIDADAAWDLGVGYVATEAGEMTGGSQGGYVEGSYLRRVSPQARLSIGPGVELVKRSVWGPIAYVRGSLELFAPVSSTGSSSDACGSATGGWHGQLGIGTYVDVQAPLDQNGGITVIAGLSLRLPAFAGVAVVIPGCK